MMRSKGRTGSQPASLSVAQAAKTDARKQYERNDENRRIPTENP
jgi:hypothetical protein